MADKICSLKHAAPYSQQSVLNRSVCRLPGYNAVWSPSGEFLAVIASPKVLILDGASKKQLVSLPCPEAKALAFSASEQLLHTHQQPHKIDGAAAPNLKVRPAFASCMCTGGCPACGIWRCVPHPAATRAPWHPALATLAIDP